MKLDELMGVKKFRNMTSDDIALFLQKEFNVANGPNAIQLLGTGANAMAVRIGNFAYKFWLIDSAYDKFVDYALNHQSNLLMPKFLSKPKTIPAFFLKHENAPARVNYIKMELLQPVTDFDIKIPVFKDSDEQWVGLDRLVVNNYKWLAKNEEIFLDWLKGAIRPPTVQRAPNSLNELSPELMHWYDTFKALGALQDDDHLDLHAENIMQRPNGELVIIDPVADELSLRLNSMFERFNRGIRLARRSAGNSQ